jgi:hypothetical protein
VARLNPAETSASPMGYINWPSLSKGISEPIIVPI